jgi:hypothetical protein
MHPGPGMERLCRTKCAKYIPILFLLPAGLWSQVPTPDVITFINGEKLSGQLRGADSTGVIFRSEMAGDLVVAWSKIQDLHSAGGFAGIRGLLESAPSAAVVPVAPRPPAVVAPPAPPPAIEARVAVPPPPAPPRPSLTPPNPPVAVVVPPAPEPVPVPVTPVAPQETPNNASLHPWLGKRIIQGWTGNASLGLSYTNATQSDMSLSAGVYLQKISPGKKDAWPLKTRTFVNFYTVYDKLTQNGDTAYFDTQHRVLVLPGSFQKSYLLHGDIVRDYFIFPRVFVYGGAVYDHNYAQSLNFLQAYGGGLGIVVYHTTKAELDLRAGVGYMEQRYYGYKALDSDNAGSRFMESFSYKLANGITFTEQAGANPAWTDSKVLYAGGYLILNVPVYHRLGLNVTSFEFWNHNPPPNFQHNIFQVSVGANYSF